MYNIVGFVILFANMNGKKKKVVKNAPKKDVELPNNSAGEGTNI